MQRDRRLTRPLEFQRVLRRGRAWADDLLVVKALPNDLGRTRFGFVVGRGVGKAVVRNRTKRRLREIARRAPVEQGWDVVVIARRGAGGVDYWTLKDSLEGLLRRAHLLALGSDFLGGQPAERG